MTIYDYKLTYDPGGVGEADISDDVETVEWVEQGTGQVTTLKIRLNAFRGKFITQSPVIIDFDRFKLRVISGAKVFERVYETQTRIPIESTAEGNVLEIECLGIEYHLQKIHFAKQFYFETPFNVLRDIISQYQTSKASLQPDIEDFDTTVGNGLPDYVANNFEFNIAETFCYDGLNDLVNRLGNSVSAGGGGDFWELFFIKGSTDDKVKILTNISGSVDSGVVLTDFSVTNEDPAEGGLDNLSGTIVGAWGADQLGSVPSNFAEFSGLLEAFELLPTFVNTVTWPSGSYSKLDPEDDFAFRNDGSPTTNTPPASPWVKIFIFDYLDDQSIYKTPPIRYSPWTNDNFEFWKNSGGNPEGIGTVDDFDFPACFDSTLEVLDEDRTRTWVDVRATSPAGIEAQYLYSGVNPYRTLRALVDGVGTGAFAGQDNNVMEFDGTKWIQKKETFVDHQVVVFAEARTFEFTTLWVDITTDDKANDCWHIPTSITNNLGYNSTPKDDPVTQTFGDTSGVEYQFDWTTLLKSPIGGEVIGANEPNYYKVGAWASFRFPVPKTGHNGESLGSEYGNSTTPFEPATIDTNNMHLSRNGKVGFNNLDAEDYGGLSSLNFHIKLQWLLGINGSLGNVQAGNFKMRATIYNSESNAMTSDFVIAFNDRWSQISLPLSGFKIYRARTPLRFTDLQQKLVLNELDVRERFRWRNVTAVAIQWQESYDEQGRYDPAAGRPNIDTAFGLGGRTILTLDGVHWGKPLFTTTAANLTGEITVGRVIEPPFLQLPFVSNLQQLRQASQSQLEIEQFPHRMFEVRTDGALDILYGESFILKKSRLVFDIDPLPSDEVKLVAKWIKYRISKPHNRPGTFERWVRGIKRIT